jgi:hypothetical protein
LPPDFLGRGRRESMPAARAALLTLVVVGYAVAQQPATPETNGSPQRATLLVRTDLDCTWSIDGKSQGPLHVGDRVSVFLGLGEHLIEATPVSGGPHWEQVMDIKDTNAKVLTIPLLETKGASERADAARAARNRGYWIDPGTHLMWAATASQSVVDWYGATKYCRGLRMGGYNDWRLPLIEELERLPTPSPVDPVAYTWSNSQGESSKEAWVFGFAGRISAKLNDDGAGPAYVMTRHALCVRRSQEADH